MRSNGSMCGLRGYRKMKRGSLNSREMDGRDALSVSPRVGPRGRKLGNADPWPDGWGRGLVVIDGVPMVEYPRDIRRKVSAAGNYGSLARRRFGMDITWLDDRIAVGGGIWSPENMAKVSLAGITHIIDMQIEFDDTPLAEPHGIAVCWNPVDDDFEFKPPEVFETRSEVRARGVGRSEVEAIYPLRCWSAPGADDDAGVVGSDGVEG